MIIAIIPAKGASNRMPEKNMYLLNGQPLIYYSIKYAQNSKLINNIYVSTDSDKIEKYAREMGLGVIRRGPELGGEAPIIDVYLHALNSLDDEGIEYIVGIQPDHPDRTVDLDASIKFVIGKKYDDIITIDSNGERNGSLKIMKAKALREKKLHVNIGAIVDNCTNIHTVEDLQLAEQKIKATSRRECVIN